MMEAPNVIKLEYSNKFCSTDKNWTLDKDL